MSDPSRSSWALLLIGALSGAGLMALGLAATRKPPARECLDICRASDARTFYAADGACLCVPACPPCTQVTATPVENNESSQSVDR